MRKLFLRALSDYFRVDEKCLRNHSGYDEFYVMDDYIQVWYKPHMIVLKSTEISTQYVYWLKFSYSK